MTEGRKIVRSQIALGGYRLAALLATIPDPNIPSVLTWSQILLITVSALVIIAITGVIAFFVAQNRSQARGYDPVADN